MRTLTANELALPIFACFQVICSLFYYREKFQKKSDFWMLLRVYRKEMCV